MRSTILSILFIGGLFGGASVPEQATDKMEAKAYDEAAILYDSTLALPDYNSERRAIHFNIGQAHYQRDSLDLAQAAYSKCTNLSKEERNQLMHRQFASWAWNNIGINRVKLGEQSQQQGASPMGGPQIGNMPNMAPPAGQEEDAKKRFEEALQAFKSALKMDPENEFARFNYELLKKRMQQAEKQKQDKQDKENQQDQQDQSDQQDKQDQDKQDQQKEDQQKQDQQKDGKSNQEKKPQPDNKEGKGQNQQQQQKEGEAEEREITPEQAMALLEAMNEKEKQFIQQLEKRKRKKGRPKRNSGPDW